MSYRTKTDDHSSATIDVEATKIRDTDQGILLTVDGDDEEWLPKSLVTDNGNGTFTMPYWLAFDHGLI